MWSPQRELTLIGVYSKKSSGHNLYVVCFWWPCLQMKCAILSVNSWVLYLFSTHTLLLGVHGEWLKPNDCFYVAYIWWAWLIVMRLFLPPRWWSVRMEWEAIARSHIWGRLQHHPRVQTWTPSRACCFKADWVSQSW